MLPKETLDKKVFPSAFCNQPELSDFGLNKSYWRSCTMNKYVYTTEKTAFGNNYKG